MPKHGSMLLYVHRNRNDKKPRTTTSTFTQLLNSVISVIHTVCKEKPQSFYVNVVDGVVSLAEVISNRLVSPVFNVRKVFLEVGVPCASSFTDVELCAFGAMNDVYSVVRQAAEQ